MHGPSALVLDVEGVIANPDIPRADAELGALWPGVTWQRVHEVRNLPAGYADWLIYSVGRMEPDYYWRNVLAGLGIDTSDVAVNAICSVMRRVWWARIDRAVLDVAASARRSGSKVGLLSNSAPEHEDTIKELVGLVDVSHFSHRTGRRKPDDDAYLAMVAELGVPPSACVFVDDKARNVDAAARNGMDGLVFESADALAGALAERGYAGVVAGGRLT